MKNRRLLPLTILLFGTAVGFMVGVGLANHHWSAFAETQRLRLQAFEQIASAERTEHIVVKALETF